jgi:hypothetical protein
LRSPLSLPAAAGGGAEFERAYGEIVEAPPAPCVLAKASMREGGPALTGGDDEEGDDEGTGVWW